MNVTIQNMDLYDHPTNSYCDIAGKSFRLDSIYMIYIYIYINLQRLLGIVELAQMSIQLIQLDPRPIDEPDGMSGLERTS